MPRLRLFSRLLAGAAMFAAGGLRGAEPVFPAHPDGNDSPLNFPVGKTLVVPIACDDADGDALTYTVTSSNPKVFARIRTGNPQMKIQVHTDNDGTGAPFDGEMEFQLYRDFTPETASFLAGYAQSGFYDNVLFHRIVKDFVVQGGDPAGTGSGITPDDPNTPDVNESADLNLNYSLPHEFRPELIFSGRGQLAMANSNGGYTDLVFQPRGNIRYQTATVEATNGTQFFISLGPLRAFGPSKVNLDYKHTICGQLVRGFDVLTKLDTLPRNASDRPTVEVKMTALSAAPSQTDGVLLLSATTTGTSHIQITARDPAGNVAVRTLQVTVDVDTINDPPILEAIDPAVVAVGRAPSLKLRSYDLESDVISTRFPVKDLFTGQTIYANVDASTLRAVAPPAAGMWDVAISVAGLNDPVSRLVPLNASRFQLLEVGLGDRKLAATPVPVEAQPGVDTGFVRVATFRYGGPRAATSAFTALVNWGDGSKRATSVPEEAEEEEPPPPPPTVTIVRSPANPALFEVRASHAYARPGVYPLRVTIDGPLGATSTAKGMVVVNPAEATLRALGQDLKFSSPLVSGRPVATFTDSTPGVKLANFSAIIDWGDGVREPGKIRQTGAGRFSVIGSHRYADPVRHAISVHIRRLAPAPAEAVAWSSAALTGFKGTQQLPPFAKASITSYWSESPAKVYRGSAVDITGTLFLMNGGSKPTNKWIIRQYLSLDPVLDENGNDTPLKMGPLNKLVSEIPLNSLASGAGGNFPFKSDASGLDFTIRLPSGDSGAGRYLITQLLYSDPLTDKMSVPKTIVFGPFNGIVSEPSFLVVKEGDNPARTASFTVKLDTNPAAEVTIPLEIVNASGSVDHMRAVLSTPQLTFTPANATAKQTVVVSAVDDGIKNSPSTGTYTIRLKPALSIDPRFDGMDGPDLTLLVQEKAGQQ